MAQRITIAINTGNSAFSDHDDSIDAHGYEIGRILRRLADDLQEDSANGDRTLRDYNGNRCGTVRIRTVRG